MECNQRFFPPIGQGLPAYRISTVNRYFEVGTINRINRLKPVNCSTKFITVALTEFAIRKKIAQTGSRHTAEESADDSPPMRNNFRQKFCFEVLKFIECIMAPLKKNEIYPPVPTSHFEM